MRWENSETATFEGSSGSGNYPTVAERMNLKDKDGSVCGYIDKAVDGTIAFYVGGVEVTVDAELSAFTDAFTAASASGPASFAFAEDTDNGVHAVTVKAPAAVTANVDFTLPDAAGTAALISQVITNGVTTKSPSEDAVFDALAIQGLPASVKVYRATLTQAGAADPTATVGQNTLGQTVTPARTSIGLYTLTAGGAVFTADKTQIFIGTGSSGKDFPILKAVRTSTTVITITTLDVDIAGPTAVVEDGLMPETAITIVVFP